MAPKLTPGFPNLSGTTRTNAADLRRQADKLTNACQSLAASPRYHELRDRFEAETLTSAEQKELTKISDQMEQWDAQRVEILSELAHRQGTTLTALLNWSKRK